MTATGSLGRRRSPELFGALLTLTLILIAALAPASGLVSADTSCPYGNCQSSTSTSFFQTALGYAVIVVVLVAIAAVVIGLLVRKSRGKGGGSASQDETRPDDDGGTADYPAAEGETMDEANGPR